MEVREELKELIEKAKDAAVAAGELPEGDYAPVQRLEVPKEKDFGDYSTNAAMQWARTAHKAPRMIADVIVKHMDTPLVSRMDIAGAGFINFFLAKDTVYTELKNILALPMATCRRTGRTGFWWNTFPPIPQAPFISAMPGALLTVLPW